MTVMSKWVSLFTLAGVLAIAGCGEEQSAASADPEVFENELVVEVGPALISNGKVDWTREAEFLQGPEIFERLAFMLETDQEDLREAVRFEFDVLDDDASTLHVLHNVEVICCL